MKIEGHVDSDNAVRSVLEDKILGHQRAIQSAEGTIAEYEQLINAARSSIEYYQACKAEYERALAVHLQSDRLFPPLQLDFVI